MTDQKQPKLSTILHQGLVAGIKKDNEKEKANLEHFRAGSSGIISSQGEVMGTCHRIAMLRKMGHNVPFEPTRSIMFAAGRFNEEVVLAALANAGQAARPGVQGEFHVDIADNIRVTGTPDVVLLDAEGNISGVLELKNVSSIYTARSVMGKREPKGDHLIQAALYSWMMGFKPATIVYSSSMDWHIPFAPKFIAEDMDGRPGVRYDKDRPMCIEPQFVIYETQWGSNGHLEYRHEDEVTFTTTEVSVDSISSYYVAVADMPASKVLGPRPSQNGVHGQKGYNKCDPKYCALADVCKKKESNFDLWLDSAKIEIQRLNSEFGYID